MSVSVRKYSCGGCTIIPPFLLRKLYLDKEILETSLEIHDIQAGVKVSASSHFTTKFVLPMKLLCENRRV